MNKHFKKENYSQKEGYVAPKMDCINVFLEHSIAAGSQRSITIGDDTNGIQDEWEGENNTDGTFSW